jgi:hypothetical protein
MSQVDTSTKSMLQELKSTVESFLRTFEWTWTKAVTFSLALTFFLMVTTSIIPSFWIYFASNTLKWNGAGPNAFLFVEIRDAVAMGLSTGPIITVLIVAAIMQNWRRRLRGQTDSRPTGGYR